MRNVELLAPCGGFEQFKAAVENGADAVYMGGPDFNARLRAENFTLDNLKEAINIAHDRDIKCYITLNTLIKDSEMEKLFEYIYRLDKAGADALILQSFGLGKAIKEEFKNMDLHMSTQGTIYNPAGVKFAEKQGYKRVVLARELGLDKIKRIAKVSEAEIEIFIHGALCICYSGQCQFSNFIGGRSGNKGACGQACRLPYEVYDDVKNLNKKPIEKSHFLSPKDICTLDKIGDIIDSGVKSLKIEGRMKSAQYVAAVTGIYRKQIDKYLKYGDVTVNRDDMKVLHSIFNRGGFSKGYLEIDGVEDVTASGESMMSKTIPKHQGVVIGEVVNNKFRGTKVEARLKEPLRVGDGVEIRGKRSSTGNVVTYVSKSNKKDIVKFGDIRDEVRVGDIIYKITDKKLMEELEDTYKGKYRSAGKPIDMYFSVNEREMNLKIKGETEISVKDSEGIEEAIKTATTKKQVEQQLRKTGETGFYSKDIELDMEEIFAIPMSRVNKLRRYALEEYIKELEKVYLSDISELKKRVREGLSPGCKDCRQSSDYLNYKEFPLEVGNTDVNSFGSLQNLYLFNYDDIKKYDIKSFNRIYISYEKFIKTELPEKFIPYIPCITQGMHDGNIEKNFDKILKVAEKTGILIGNQGWLEKFLDSGIKVYGDYGLNIYNSRDMKLYENLGLKSVCMSMEEYFDRESSDEHVFMKPWNMDIEIIAGGNLPLMVSAHDFFKDIDSDVRELALKDRKGAVYKVQKSDKNGQNLITAKRNSSITEKIRNKTSKYQVCLRIFG